MKKFVSILAAAMLVLSLMVPIIASAAGAENTEIMYVATRKGRLLNVREQPSKDSRILYRVGSGKTLKILRDEETPEGWVKVQRGTKRVGYAMTQFLKDTKTSSYYVTESQNDFKAVTPYTVTALARGKNTTESVELRTEPSKNAAAIRRLAAGDKLEVIEVGKTWSKVVDAKTGITGYAANDYLKAA